MLKSIFDLLRLDPKTERVLTPSRRLVPGGWRTRGAGLLLALGLLVLCPLEVRGQSLAEGLGDNDSAQSEQGERATDEILAPLDSDPELRPDQRAARAFEAPPEATRLSRRSNLWIDPQRKRVYVDGYIAIRDGPLEMFACPMGTKEHESIVATLAQSSEVHTALLAIGARAGTPVRWDPDFIPPTGQRIRVWVMWRDPQGRFQVSDARQWIRNAESGKAMDDNWVFGGSDFWTDPADGKEYYQADGGDMICVSNFPTAMMDVPFASSADTGSLLFRPFTGRIPAMNTPVRLVLVPIPDPSDTPPKQPQVDPDEPPTAAALPVREDEQEAKPADEPKDESSGDAAEKDASGSASQATGESD